MEFSGILWNFLPQSKHFFANDFIQSGNNRGYLSPDNFKINAPFVGEQTGEATQIVSLQSSTNDVMSFPASVWWVTMVTMAYLGN